LPLGGWAAHVLNLTQLLVRTKCDAFFIKLTGLAWMQKNPDVSIPGWGRQPLENGKNTPEKGYFSRCGSEQGSALLPYNSRCSFTLFIYFLTLRTMKKAFYLVLLTAGSVFLQGCPGGKGDPEPSGTVITDPNELSKVMLIPGATLEKGTPPPVTTTPDTPKLSTISPEVNAISGQEAIFSLNYSNAVGKITVIYIQFEGADSYFKIPISGNSGTNGTIRIPMKIPEKYTARPSGNSFGRFCCFAGNSASVMRQAALCNNSFTSILPPPPGKGTVNIGGRNYDATAVCDLPFGAFGRGYAISISPTEAIIFYNMNQGTNQLGNYRDLIDNSQSGVVSSPFALYVNGTSLYYSLSGTATANGKKVSTSVRLEDFDGRQINLTASGNCQ